MKALDLVKLIDKLVEKKLNSKIQQLIKEEVSSQVNVTMGRMLVEVLNKNNGSSNSNETEEPIQSPIKTNNPRLNSVLAETAKNFKPLKKDVGGSLAQLLDGDFDKIGLNEDVNYELQSPQSSNQSINDGTNVGFLKSIVSEGITTGTSQQSVLGTSAIPDVLKGVFKRDFRDVIKKMDEQKKNGSPGMINPNMILSG